MISFLQKLDLTAHFAEFEQFFARPKPPQIIGDQARHFLYIEEIDKLESFALPSVINLDSAIARLNKQGSIKLYEIFAFVRIARFLQASKKRFKEGILKEWLDKIEINEPLISLSSQFDLDGNLIESASLELTATIRAIEGKKKQIKTELSRMMSSNKLAPYLVDRQVHFVNNVECLLVRGGFNHVLSGKVIDRTPAGFFYVSPRNISDLVATIDDLENQKEQIIYQLEQDASVKLHSWSKNLKYINEAFDTLDHYAARVAFAKSKNLSIVAPQNTKRIRLVDFAHPAIKDAKSVSVDFDKQILLITGVNAGGKTMLLKSILSAVLMSRLLIPMKLDSSKSIIGRFSHIEAIISDPQNAKNDISTFAGRMEEFASMLARNGVLLGVDEIELGTDSDEAASLFRIVLEELIRRDFKIVVTTHHKRLAALMASDSKVELLAALYDEKLAQPTYQFLQGTIGKSYAFETASRYGIPPNIVANARKLYGSDQERLNDLIERSSSLELELRDKIVASDEKLAKLEKKEAALKSQEASLQSEYSSKKMSLEKEYREAIDLAKEAVKKGSQQEIHKALNEAHSKKPKEEKKPPKQEIAVGSFVKFGELFGTVKSIKKSNAYLDIDGKTVTAPLFLLKSAEVKMKNLFNKQARVVLRRDAKADIKLDLHGLRVDEALERLDQFLSDALIAGFDEVLVYHGIGAGILARAVKEELKVHPRVVSFEDAPHNMGGFGATLIRL